MKYYKDQIENSKTLRQRVIILMALFHLAMVFLMIRLYRLQTAEQTHYEKMATENRSQYRPIQPPRGLIFDRNGKLLVKNRAVFNVTATPEKDFSPELIERLGRLLELSPTEIEVILQKYRPKSFRSVLLKSGVSKDIVTRIEENPEVFQGVNIQTEPQRHYPYNSLAAHALGYLGEVSENQLVKLKPLGYKRGDMIGQYGLEKTYNNYLQGEKGYKIIEVNAYGRELNLLEQVPPKPGHNLTVTLDLGLQRAAEKALENSTGSCVVLDIKSGEILALVSNPAFDPNLFAAHIKQNDWFELFNNPKHPLYNRAVQSVFPPASTFKIVSALAGLDSGTIDAEDRFTCWGHYLFGRMVFDCWKQHGHGYVNAVEGLRISCNVFFYNLAREMGPETLSKYARMLGLGRKTGVDLANEKAGTVPDPDWKLKYTGEIWYPGDTIIMGIGQGFLTVSPMQMANLMATIASGGVKHKPHLARKIEAYDSTLIKEFKPALAGNLPIKPEVLETVKDGLWRVVNLWGTGSRARVGGMDISGKTGTAQVIAKPEAFEDLEFEEIPERFRPHGWFVSFAPLNNPEIAVAIIVENGGEGSYAAAPVAKVVYDEYFKDREPDFTLEKFFREKAARETARRQKHYDSTKAAKTKKTNQ